MRPEDLIVGRSVRSAGAAGGAPRAVRRTPAGERLTDDEVAWLGVLLTHVPVRDVAWERTDGADEHIALWTDVLRRAEPELTAAPGCLLAFAAWRAGQGALAAVALERVLARHPDYSLALLLDDLLRRGVPPASWTAGRRSVLNGVSAAVAADAAAVAVDAAGGRRPQPVSALIRWSPA